MKYKKIGEIRFFCFFACIKFKQNKVTKIVNINLLIINVFNYVFHRKFTIFIEILHNHLLKRCNNI